MACAVLAVVYLVQFATPLRLHNDTTVLISMAESAANGGGFLYHGQVSHYPQGYPALIALLLKLNAFHIWTAVLINFAFLALGLWAASRLFPPGRAIILLTLLSFVTIKHYTIPLTDLVFFGIAMLCILMFQRGRLLEAAMLVLLGITLRRNGIALVPPLLWIFYKRRPVFVVPALIASVLTVYATSTLTDFHKTVAGHSIFDSAVQILGFRAMEFGEIAINMPSIALPPAAQIILPCIGALVLGLIAAGIWIGRESFGAPEIFFLGYAAILFVWPYYDPRFWLPVLPLIFAYAARPLRRVPPQIVAAWGMAFAMIGVAVLVQSTRITFSGADFPNAYGNAQFRPTYCAFYRSCPFDPKDIDPDGIHLLRTYR